MWKVILTIHQIYAYFRIWPHGFVSEENIAVILHFLCYWVMYPLWKLQSFKEFGFNSRKLSSTLSLECKIIMLSDVKIKWIIFRNIRSSFECSIVLLKRSREKQYCLLSMFCFILILSHGGFKPLFAGFKTKTEISNVSIHHAVCIWNNTIDTVCIVFIGTDYALKKFGRRQ